MPFLFISKLYFEKLLLLDFLKHLTRHIKYGQVNKRLSMISRLRHPDLVLNEKESVGFILLSNVPKR